ncbi:pancreatic triacylglycerol lipase [Condylostylus longicornis]|uniref:pancreatic triacylglycerol lipase n=1 Tax=Condylostylus longicornis TaxID=2530218 RepID=UPI00244DFB67|nr:pancreatic triacylglycerol lipase [Condylostylus longicornis]
MYIANSTSLLLQTMLYLSNQTSKTASNALNDFPPALKSELNEVRCFGIYGCFPLTGPFTTNTRQINVHPQRPSEIQPHFPVFNKENPENPNFVDLKKPTDVTKFGINPYAKFFVIVHGYLEAGNKPWMLDTAKKLLRAEPDCSVMMIDWGAGSHPPYTQAVANIRLVGVMAAHIIHLIYAETGMKNLDQVHMIGHSLGSHLSGYTGTALQKEFGLKLGRITGLDPAAPLFSGTEPIVRLDRSDAKYVDVIHTDSNPLMSGGLGMNSPIGHVDFYPNGGFDNPGCGGNLHEHITDEKSFFTSVRHFLGCNHIRSHQFFTESITPKCGFNSITCDSYESFKSGKCDRCGENNNYCIRFGYNSYRDYQKLLERGVVNNNTLLMAYLSTAKSKPFCRHHYKITVRISNSEESILHGGEIGTLSIKLHARKRRETETMPFSSSPQYFEPGEEYVSVVPGKDIQNPTHATITWDYQTSLLNPLTWRIVSTPRIYVDFILIESIENPKFEMKLCPQMDSPIISGSDNILEINKCKF